MTGYELKKVQQLYADVCKFVTGSKVGSTEPLKQIHMNKQGVKDIKKLLKKKEQKRELTDITPTNQYVENVKKNPSEKLSSIDLSLKSALKHNLTDLFEAVKDNNAKNAEVRRTPASAMMDNQNNNTGVNRIY